MALLKIVSGEKPREIAVQVLGRRTDKTFTEDLLESALAGQNLLPPDRALCMELVYGMVRWQSTLDWLIARKTANRTQKPALQNLLRLGLYQIFWLQRIPAHAAVHVTVELAKRHGFGAQAGFVNALLRGYLRELDSTRASLDELKRSQPAVGYSHPEWLVSRWQARWGNERASQLLSWDNSPPRAFARVNTLKIQAAELLPLWREEDVEYDFVRHDWLEENLVYELKSHPPLNRLASFQKGYFYVQDPGTLLAATELDAKPGDRVLDLCAAPGGKLTYLAQLMQNEGSIVAHEVSESRIALIRENCARLGITCVQTALSQIAGEANEAISESFLRNWAPNSFERILVDAPCSNTGVMRRRVDLRWRVRAEEIERLSQTQRQLLRAAVQLLKPGGVLIYSTCSLEPEENRQVVDKILSEFPGLRCQSDRQLTPFSDQVDGAYVARIDSGK